MRLISNNLIFLWNCRNDIGLIISNYKVIRLSQNFFKCKLKNKYDLSFLIHCIVLGIENRRDPTSPSLFSSTYRSFN